MERAIDVTISVDKEGNIVIKTYENQSGDHCSMEFTKDDNPERIINGIGNEIYSWISLMLDEIEEEEEYGM